MDTGSQHSQEDLHALEQRSLRLADDLAARLSLASEACRELGQRAAVLAGEPDAARRRIEDAESTRPEAAPLTDSARRRLAALETEREALASELNAARDGLARAQTEPNHRFKICL